MPDSGTGLGSLGGPADGPITSTAQGPTSGSGPRAGFTLASALGGVCALLGFVLGADAITDNSLLTHLATGDLILDYGRVPTADPYSRTAPGQPWTVQSWLASVVYAGVDRLIGGAGLRLLHGVTAGLIGFGLWRLTAPAVQVVARSGLATLPLVIGAGLWSPRPFMFGLLAMVGLLLVVRTGRQPWLLVPLFWFWVNSHGSFPLGIALLVALIVGQLIDDRLTSPSVPERLSEPLSRSDWADPAPTSSGRLVRYLIMGLVGVLAGGLNPIGPRILWFPVQLLGRREALEGVVEWQPPSFTSSPELAFLTLVPLVAVAARRGAPWRDLLPSVCFLIGGFLAIRNISVAAVVVTVLLAPRFRDLFGVEDGASVNLVSRALGSVVAAGAVAAAVVVAGQPGFDLRLYPVDEVDFLESRGLVADPDVGLIHREAVGNYLAYRYGPDSSVFIDDRFDFYPTSVTGDHLTLVDGGDYHAVLERWDGEVVLWEADSVLAQWLRDSDQWAVAIDEDDWIVACRITSPTLRRCITVE